MTITWLGHSCFLLESGGYRLLLDPFKGVPGHCDIAVEADEVCCSHDHFDHAYTEKLRLTAGKESPFSVRRTQTFHDGQGGALRGGNTVHTLTAGGITVVHLGDLGHALTAAQLAAIGPCDVLLLPVGGTYTVDAAGAKAAADQLSPRVVIPMHYRSAGRGFDNIETVEPFLALWPAERVRRYPGNVLTVDGDTPEQVAVLTAP